MADNLPALPSNGPLTLASITGDATMSRDDIKAVYISLRKKQLNTQKAFLAKRAKELKAQMKKRLKKVNELVQGALDALDVTKFTAPVDSLVAAGFGSEDAQPHKKGGAKTRGTLATKSTNQVNEENVNRDALSLFNIESGKFSARLTLEHGAISLNGTVTVPLPAEIAALNTDHVNSAELLQQITEKEYEVSMQAQLSNLELEASDVYAQHILNKTEEGKELAASLRKPADANQELDLAELLGVAIPDIGTV